jgi:hypothetical protein
MKHVTTIMIVACVLLATSAFGQGLGPKGQMWTGGYLGYGIGMGDPFVDEDAFSFKAGLGYGGTFHYGLNEKMIIGGELGFQSYKTEFDFLGSKESSTTTEMNIFFSGLYTLNYEDGKALFLSFGGGLYGGDNSEFGFFGGILYRKLISEKIFLYGMPRLHLIMADETMKILQLSVGVQIPIGG